MVVLLPDNVIPLTEAEHQLIPCHFLRTQQAEKRLLVIEYTPGSEQATRERIVAVHLRAYARHHQILRYQIFDGFVPTLPESPLP